MFDQDGCYAWAIEIAHKFFFKQLEKVYRELTTALINLNLTKQSLISDWKTCWGLTHKVIQRLLEQDQGIHIELSADRKVSYLVPT